METIYDSADVGNPAKKMVFIQCERCGGSFSENLMGHYENPFSHWEADLCDTCADLLDSAHEVA